MNPTPERPTGCTCPDYLVPIAALIEAEHEAHQALLTAIKTIPATRLATAKDRQSEDFATRADATLALMDAQAAGISTYIDWRGTWRTLVQVSRACGDKDPWRFGGSEAGFGSLLSELIRELSLGR